ncbi:HAD family hydrolase [Longibacter salinarum]|uniref:HAD family hydrolase n=1 Tax=Longibacter salinarum TaxID=1850348 RepID=UPI001FE449BE|nr:HAD-IA family hydrolase [Longibacter salinarum]
MSTSTLSNDIDFVFFDVDDTLLDHSHAERHALADVRSRYLAVFGHLSVDELQQTYHEINRPLWEKYSSGEIEKEIVKHDRFPRLLNAIDAPHADAARIGSVYLQRYAEHWKYVDGARDTYAEIAERYRVGVLTNGFAEVQAQKLKKFPEIRDRADVVLVSEETGHMKPHPHVFEVAAERAEVTPERILYVGDSWRSDVEGGSRAGWHVAWFARSGVNGQEMNGRTFAFQDWSDLLSRL